MGRNRHGVHEVKLSRDVEELMRVLSTGQRLEVMRLLAATPHCVTELAEQLFVPLASVSRDLVLLERRGLVRFRRHKTRRVYELTDRVVVGERAEMMVVGSMAANHDKVFVCLETRAAPDDVRPDQSERARDALLEVLSSAVA